MSVPHNKNLLWPYLALAAGVLCIAWSAIFVHWTGMSGTASAFYRMLLPALALLPTCFFDRTQWRVDWKTLTVIVCGGFFFALDLALYNTAVLRTSAANATLLGNNTPIIVGLLTWTFFRRKPPITFWLGLALALAGATAVVWNDLSRNTTFGSGDFLALAAGACFAVYLFVTEQVRATTSTFVLLRLSIFSSTVFLFFISLALGTSLKIPNGTAWASLVGLGFISQLGGYLALSYALGHLPATLTSVSLLSQVPVTGMLAALLLAEHFSTTQIIGGIIVLAGVALGNQRSNDSLAEKIKNVPYQVSQSE